jgi:hypothetical protein
MKVRAIMKRIQTAPEDKKPDVTFQLLEKSATNLTRAQRLELINHLEKAGENCAAATFARDSGLFEREMKLWVRGGHILLAARAAFHAKDGESVHELYGAEIKRLTKAKNFSKAEKVRREKALVGELLVSDLRVAKFNPYRLVPVRVMRTGKHDVVSHLQELLRQRDELRNGAVPMDMLELRGIKGLRPATRIKLGDSLLLREGSGLKPLEVFQ